jgi:hypothetical protein
MTKFSVKYKKEYLKAKKMLGVKGVKKEHVILGLVALGVIYFVIKKKGGGGGMIGDGGYPGVGVSTGRDILGRQEFDPSGLSIPEFGQYGMPAYPENVTNIISPHEYGRPPHAFVGPDVHPPAAYDMYSGAVGDIQYIPSTADLIPYRKESEPPYEYGWTYQPY